MKNQDKTFTPPTGYVEHFWRYCTKHQRLEGSWQGLNEDTAEYIEKHSREITKVFND